MKFIHHPSSCGRFYVVFLTDYGFWADNQVTLSEWCLQHDCEQQGCVVYIPDDIRLTTFILRWQ